MVALSGYLDDDEQALYIEESQALRPIVRLMVRRKKGKKKEKEAAYFCLVQVSNDADLRMEALKMISKSAGVPELRAQLLSIGAIAPLVQMMNVQDRSLVREEEVKRRERKVIVCAISLD